MIYIGIDDTDNPLCGGTGRVARQLAATLRGSFPILGVSRHQFLVDPRVPYTSNNSGNVIHLLTDDAGLAELADRLERPLLDLCLEGSDPGLCVVRSTAAGHPLGQAAQERLLTQDDAFVAARETGAVLRGLGGTRDGVIGAIAGAILAAGGDDGRFVEVGQSRDLEGTVTVAILIAAGIPEVRAPDGSVVADGEIDTRGGRVRPVLRNGRPVLMVEPISRGRWQVVEQGKGKTRERVEAVCRPS